MEEGKKRKYRKKEDRFDKDGNKLCLCGGIIYNKTGWKCKECAKVYQRQKYKEAKERHKDSLQHYTSPSNVKRKMIEFKVTEDSIRIDKLKLTYFLNKIKLRNYNITLDDVVEIYYFYSQFFFTMNLPVAINPKDRLTGSQEMVIMVNHLITKEKTFEKTPKKIINLCK